MQKFHPTTKIVCQEYANSCTKLSERAGKMIEDGNFINRVELAYSPYCYRHWLQWLAHLWQSMSNNNPFKKMVLIPIDAIQGQRNLRKGYKPLPPPPRPPPPTKKRTPPPPRPSPPSKKKTPPPRPPPRIRKRTAPQPPTMKKKGTSPPKRPPPPPNWSYNFKL